MFVFHVGISGGEMLPLAALRKVMRAPVCVELKCGDSLNGTLARCDAWMNMAITDVTRTTADGAKFFKCKSCVVRGSAVRSVSLGDLEALEKAAASRKRAAPKPTGKSSKGARQGQPLTPDSRGGRGQAKGAGRGGEAKVRKRPRKEPGA